MSWVVGGYILNVGDIKASIAESLGLLGVSKYFSHFSKETNDSKLSESFLDELSGGNIGGKVKGHSPVHSPGGVAHIFSSDFAIFEDGL